jgi:hypothetical protein
MKNVKRTKKPSLQPLKPAGADTPVDARWRQITHLASTSRAAEHADDDPWIQRGVAYLQRLRSCQDADGRERVAKRMPDIDAAHRLHAASKLDRGAVEARLLAGQSIGKVARCSRLARKTVIAYEKLFFQVLGRLNARVFILLKAVNVDPFKEGFGMDEVDVFLKWIGFVMGLRLLERAIPFVRAGATVPVWPDQTNLDELQSLATVVAGQRAMLVSMPVFPARLSPNSVLEQIEIVTALSDETSAPSYPRASNDAGWVPDVTPAQSMPSASAYNPLRDFSKERREAEMAI